MIARTLAELVRDLQTRRTVGDKPPVLLLGAGASIDAGIGAMPELYEFFGCKTFEEFCTYIDTTSPAERYRYLSQFLQTRTPETVTAGYRALATLCAQNYFDLVLTTNMDPLLDDALAAARLRRRDYLLLVNGVIRSDRIAPLLSGQSPRVKIVKLHGDLFQRFMAWTVSEMDKFVTDIADDLRTAVADRDFLVVGYSLRDTQVRSLVEGAGGSVWFTHPVAVPPHVASMTSPASKRFRTVVAPECAFEKFFPALAAALHVDAGSTAADALKENTPDVVLRSPSAPVDDASRRIPFAVPGPARSGLPQSSGVLYAETLDDVMAATFAVEGPDGHAASTAFLLANPRVVVCDAFAVAPCIVDGAVTLVTADGMRYLASVLELVPSHPFGPIFLQPPVSLAVAGIALDTSPLAADDVVQVFVAAGERTGIGVGTVTTPSMSPQSIGSISRKVEGLAEMRCVVAQGSSGAPVVNRAFAARAFVVAASLDAENPRCFVYPAFQWKASVMHARTMAGQAVVDVSARERGIRAAARADVRHP